MSKFVKGAAKGAGGLAKSGIKAAFSGMISQLVKEILEETGVTTIAKDKMMEAGFKVVKEMGVDPKKIQRDLVKTALKKELGLK